MGAEVFITRAKGASAKEAFDEAVRRAQHDWGHSGYTGSIAEKDTFTMIELPEGQNAIGYAEKLLDEGDERIDDKWGPAGCIQEREGVFVFFGWASS
jgi:hypothetical protein